MSGGGGERSGCFQALPPPLQTSARRGIVAPMLAAAFPPKESRRILLSL